MERRENTEKWLEKVGEKLNNYSEPLPTDSWEQMQARLDKAIIKTRNEDERSLNRWLGVAAFLLIAVSCVYFLTQKEPVIKNLPSSSQVSIAALANQALDFPQERVELFDYQDARFSVSSNTSKSGQIFVEHNDRKAIYRWRDGEPQLVVQHGFSKAQLNSFVHMLLERQSRVFEALHLQ